MASQPALTCSEKRSSSALSCQTARLQRPPHNESTAMSAGQRRRQRGARVNGGLARSAVAGRIDGCAARGGRPTPDGCAARGGGAERRRQRASPARRAGTCAWWAMVASSVCRLIRSLSGTSARALTSSGTGPGLGRFNRTDANLIGPWAFFPCSDTQVPRSRWEYSGPPAGSRLPRRRRSTGSPARQRPRLAAYPLPRVDRWPPLLPLPRRGWAPARHPAPAATRANIALPV